MKFLYLTILFTFETFSICTAAVVVAADASAEVAAAAVAAAAVVAAAVVAAAVAAAAAVVFLHHVSIFDFDFKTYSLLFRHNKKRSIRVEDQNQNLCSKHRSSCCVQLARAQSPGAKYHKSSPKLGSGSAQLVP